jgi:predicted phosphoribosyltransferase
MLRREADEVVCPYVPPTFGSVSRFYNAFPQIRDDEVIALVEAG